jgi:hypothetical protein
MFQFLLILGQTIPLPKKKGKIIIIILILSEFWKVNYRSN